LLQSQEKTRLKGDRNEAALSSHKNILQISNIDGGGSIIHY